MKTIHVQSGSFGLVNLNLVSNSRSILNKFGYRLYHVAKKVVSRSGSYVFGKFKQSELGSRDGLVVRTPGFDSRIRRHMWVEFVVGSLLSPKSCKNQHS